ncbi:MAG TPA: DUF4276 family protein [Alphaproteobacteria bacterium]|nr:DUF4276 family protein [Alphaproteobacteria bacterium]
MVSEIRLYVEGGGEGSQTKAIVREGFQRFLQDIVRIARSRKVRWQIVACGPRQAAFENFLLALETHPEAFNVLLVDSEGPVNHGPKEYLKSRDRWNLPDIGAEHYHLMVQMMEAWLVADRAALSRFYGQGFNVNAIPRNPNVEQIAKPDLESALKEATRHTAKGAYHKIHHGPKILGQLDVPRVRSAAPHCDRLFTTLADRIERPDEPQRSS